MSASANDLVRNATPNFATTLANSMLISDTSLVLASGTGLPTATAITLVIDATNSTGTYTPTTMEVVTGTLSGTTLSNLKRGLDGSTQQGHASGANVVMWITANLWNDWQTAFLLGHSQLTGAHLPSLPLTTPKITTGLNDANGNAEIGFTATGSAVNNINTANAATGNAPAISAVGSDTNISLNLVPKGTGTIQFAGNPVTPGAWQTWSAILTNLTLGNGASYAVYAQTGKTVFYRYSFLMGSTSAVGTAPTISLPVTANANYANGTYGYMTGFGFAQSVGNGYTIFSDMSSATTMRPVLVNAAGTYLAGRAAFSATVPGTFTTGDWFTLHGTYEAA